MPTHDRFLVIAVIAAHAAAEDHVGALTLWKKMIHKGMEPAAEAYKAVYQACESAGAHAEAKGVLEYAERQGIPLMTLVEGVVGG